LLVQRLRVWHFTDPGCPWAYSAWPALSTLRWRYGDQLDWRLVLIGLTESADQYVRRGYTPVGAARGYRRFRRWGMPLATGVKPRVAATARACRALVAVRERSPEHLDAALRALQFAQFTTTAVLDDDADLRAALATVPGLDAGAIAGALDDPEIDAAYIADRRLARTAEGTPTEFQGKAARTDGPVRYTAPSLIFERLADGARLEAGGFQPVEAYDVLIANLDAGLERRPAPADPLDALDDAPYGLTTAEVAAILRDGNEPADPVQAEDALIGLVAEGTAVREPLGDGALWRSARYAAPPSASRREASAIAAASGVRPAAAASS
jgi:2-hydroxychromene-2-carboxylate isomerase